VFAECKFRRVRGCLLISMKVGGRVNIDRSYVGSSSLRDECDELPAKNSKASIHMYGETFRTGC
jgi:hypothetical protein